MTRVIVYHQDYGCDTGCCGHYVELLEPDQERGEGKGEFEFAHPYVAVDDPDASAFRAFAEDMVRDHYGNEHVADLDWDNCIIIDD